MALYKPASFIQECTDAVFDVVHDAGKASIYSGIYRCEVCGHEVAIQAPATLPSGDHHMHVGDRRPIRWRLVVFAQPI